MLEDSVKKSVPNSNGFGKPTNKMLAYVKKLAEQVGVDLNEDDLSTFHKVSVLINELQKKIKPTDKQISFAKKLAEKMNAEIPQKALESKAAMSRWLEKVLKHEQVARKGIER